MHAGVDWSLVAEHVNMDNAYERFQDPEAAEAQQQGWVQWVRGWVRLGKQGDETRSAPQTPGTVTPHSHGHAPGKACMLQVLFDALCCDAPV